MVTVWIADADRTPAPWMPSTINATPFVPNALLSRKRDIVATTSWSKIGKSSNAWRSTAATSRFSLGSVLTSGLSPLTVIC